jgi:type VI secretion system FHA domain protein
MNLTLEIISANGSGLGAGRRKVFGVEGGRIGRAPDCDWVLPSPNKYVSRHHATILEADGVFYVKAEGENGVAINSPSALLPFATPSPIQNGDRLFIDEYEILASVVTDAARPPLILDDPFAEDADPVSLMPIADPRHGEDLDPLSLLPGTPIRPAPRERGYFASPQGSVLTDPFVPPPPLPTPAAASSIPAAAAIPANWNETTFGFAADPKPDVPPRAQPRSPAKPQVQIPTEPARRPVSRTPPPAADPPSRPAPIAPPRPVAGPRAAQTVPPAMPPAAGLDLNSMLRAAGVDPQGVSPEVAATLGQILKLVVQGTIDVLRAREEVKTQFRLAVTRVQASDNNPLTFAVDADDAINSLLNRHNAAFLPPLEAFQRAFDDIRAHQVAMLAGMRAGFENLMARFDPQQLQEQFDKQAKRGGLLGVRGTPKYWEFYADFFAGLRGDREDAFRRLFGEEFSLAYEKQIELLKRSRGSKIR